MTVAFRFTFLYFFYPPKISICFEGRLNYWTKYLLTQRKKKNICWQVYLFSLLLVLVVIGNLRGITKLITDLIHHSLYRRKLRCRCEQLGYIRQKQPVIWWKTLQSPIQTHSELFRQYIGLFGRRLSVVTPPVFLEHLKPEVCRFGTKTSLPLRSMFPSSRTSCQMLTVLRPNKRNTIGENLGIT